MDNVELLKTNKPEIEALDLETVDLKSLTKEQLINLVEQHKTACANYENTIESMKEKNKEATDELTEYYNKHMSELNSLVKYYERKLKVLKDIINIETGGEK